MLFYGKPSLGIQEFSQLIQYLVATSSIDIMAEDFSYDLLKVIENKLLDIFTDHVLIINTHIWIIDRSRLYQGLS